MASTYSELTYLEYTGAVDNSGNGVKARFDFQGVDRGAQFIANATWSVSMSNTDGPMCILMANNQEVSGVTAKILTSVYESQVASGTLEMYPLTAGTTYRLQAYTEGGTPEVDLTFTPELNNNPRAKDLASGTLAESISASTTNLLVYVGDGSASTIKAVWPDTPFYVTLMPASPSAGVPNSLDSEIVKVTAVGNDQLGNTALTVTRAQRGTTGKAFTAGAIVTNAVYAGDAVLLSEEETSETETPWIGTEDIKDDAVTSDKADLSVLTSTSSSITLSAGVWLVTHKLSVGQKNISNAVVLIYTINGFPNQTTIAGKCDSQNLWQTSCETSIITLDTTTQIKRTNSTATNVETRDEAWTAVRVK